MSSDAELLARIAALSGAIQQHRQATSQNPNSFRGGHSSYGGRGASWVRGRGSPNRTLGHPGHTASYNKTLVLNRPSATPVPTPISTPSPTPSQPHTPIHPKSPHRTLILNKPAHATPSTPPTVTPAPRRSPHKTLILNASSPMATNDSGEKRVTIEGVDFIVKGKKLIRQGCIDPSLRGTTIPQLSGSRVLVRRMANKSRDKNKNMVIGKVPKVKRVIKKIPLRSKRGNMILVREPEGYVRQGRSGKSLVLRTKKAEKRYCGPFTRYGKCPNGKRCAFIHDPKHRAICPRFLQNRCPKSAELCRLSHEPTPCIMPHCVHFQRGRCTNEQCTFPHVRVRPDAPVCRAFAMEGYCRKGLHCAEKHIHVCPEFAETGKCSNANCRLPHVARRTAEDSKAAGIVRPGSWVSPAYYHTHVKAKAVKRQARQQANQNHLSTQPSTDSATPEQTHASGEEEEEEGYVRLFDDGDDEGWSQYLREQDDDEVEKLRFAGGADDDDEESEEEDQEQYSEESDGEQEQEQEEEEEEDNDNESMEEDGEEYDEYEIADDDDSDQNNQLDQKMEPIEQMIE